VGKERPHNPLLTFTKAGSIAGVSRQLIAEWVDGGKGPLPSVPLSGKSSRRRIFLLDLYAFLDDLREKKGVNVFNVEEDEA